MELVGWVYRGGDGGDQVMEAKVGDTVFDDCFGHCVLLGALENGDLNLRVDGEEKQRTAGHIKVATPREDAAAAAGGDGAAETAATIPEEAPVLPGEGGEDQAVVEDGVHGVNAGAPDGGEAPDVTAGEEQGEKTASADIFEKVTGRMVEQANLVGFDRSACDLYFFKSVVSPRPQIPPPHLPMPSNLCSPSSKL